MSADWTWGGDEPMTTEQIAALRGAVRPSRTSFLFFKFVHNALIHPLLSLPWEPKWAQRAHDWTAKQCPSAG